MKLNRTFCVYAIFCFLLADAPLAAHVPIYDSSARHDFASPRMPVSAGETLFDGWTDQAGRIYSISGNSLEATTSSTQGFLTNLALKTLNPASGSPNIQGTISVPNGIPTPATANGLVLRFQPNDSFYLFQLSPNTLYIYKIMDGHSEPALATIAVHPNTADSYTLTGSAVNFGKSVSLRASARDARTGKSIGAVSVFDSTNPLLTIGKAGVDTWAGDNIAGPMTTRYSRIVFTQLKTPPQSRIFPKLGFIGDSVTAGYNQAGKTITPGKNDVATLTLDNLRETPGGVRADKGIPWSFYDQGVSGSSTANWLPGGPTSLLSRAEVAFTSAFGAPNPKRNPVWIFMMMGSNDVRSDNMFTPEQHEKNLMVITENLVDQGYNVVINYPQSFVTPTSFNGVTWNAQSLSLLRAYLPEEKTVVAAFAKTYPHRVFMGETSAFAYFAKHPELFQEYRLYGGLHPNGNGGTAALAKFWSRSFARIKILKR